MDVYDDHGWGRVITSICTAVTRLYIKTQLDGTMVVSGDTAVYTAVRRLAATVYFTSAGWTIEYPTSSALRRVELLEFHMRRRSTYEIRT